jgi:tetratricopeptide (TPR) repeat protein
MTTIEQAFELALQHHRSGRLAEAQAIYQKILESNPRHAGSLNLLGVIAVQQRQYGSGIALIEQAIARDPHQASFHSNLGEAHRGRGDFERARASFERALRIDPALTETHNNLGLVLQACGDFPAARRSLERAIELRPDNAEAHYNLARLLLLLGDFGSGWREHGWRRRIVGHPSQQLASPPWDGRPLEHERLLLYGEQGLGDNLQMIRYLSLVRQVARHIEVQLPAALLPLMAVSGIQGLPLEGPAPPHDAHCSLADLPAIFSPTESSIPNAVPYLSAHEERVRQWTARMTAYPGYRVGIAWQGNPSFALDELRSIQLVYFAPLAHVPGVRLVSLQKKPGSEQIDALAGGFELLRFDDQLDVSHGSFMDTAALMQGLDLVVTSDTSIAHLAGALAVPTWVILPHVPDWRWMLERSDSPWYPTLRLFRQSGRGQWGEVLARATAALAERVAAANTNPSGRVKS